MSANPHIGPASLTTTIFGGRVSSAKKSPAPAWSNGTGGSHRDVNKDLTRLERRKSVVTAPNLKNDGTRVNALDEPWRSMTAEDALRHLVAEDALRRTSEGQSESQRLGLGGLVNRRLLVAWRRENGLCAKCGRAIPADEPEFRNCSRCRSAFRDRARRKALNLTEAERLARNARARKSYFKIVHGTPPPPKVVAPVVAVVAQKQTAAGPKRDRAAYFRAYRAAKADREAEAKS